MKCDVIAEGIVAAVKEVELTFTFSCSFRRHKR